VIETKRQFLPFALPDFDESEFREVREVLESGWLTTGPKTKQFEENFRTFVGAKHAIALNSCTAAMHLALESIGLSRNDLVITTPYTFAATGEVIRYFDAIPIFVDIEPDTLNLDPKKLRETIEASSTRERIRAIIPVHFAGQPCDMDPICEVASQYNIAVIEDAAHSFPASYKGRRIGIPLKDGIRNLTCFSFYATKTITTGEGGMITTEDDELAERCRIMSLHGISRDAWKRYTAEGSWYYEIIAPGFKYNMTDLASAVGLAQLVKAERMLARRKEIAAIYSRAFSEIPELEIPSVRSNVEHAWHLYVLRLHLERFQTSSTARPRDLFIQELREQNIGCSVHFIPLHIHPYYRDTYGFSPQDFPIAYAEYQRSLSLPIYSRMSDQDVDDVVSFVRKIVAKLKA
jgi:perosamine synthetase